MIQTTSLVVLWCCWLATTTAATTVVVQPTANSISSAKKETVLLDSTSHHVASSSLLSSSTRRATRTMNGGSGDSDGSPAHRPSRLSTVHTVTDQQQSRSSSSSSHSGHHHQPSARRSIQTTTSTTNNNEYKYKASYTAEFQHVKSDSACVGGRPELRVLCTGTIRYVNASWPASITCEPFTLPMSDTNEEDWVTTARNGDYTNGLYCTIDCESIAGECARYTNAIPNFSRLARVDYECAGDVYDDIGSLLVLTPTTTTSYTCPSDTTKPSQSHYARLGVSCPNGTGGASSTAVAATTATTTDNDTNNEVSNNFVLFECIVTAATGYVLSLNDKFFDVGDQLFCAILDSCGITNTNRNCDCTDPTNPPCPLDLGDVAIVADIYNFPPACVTTADGVTIPVAPPSSVDNDGSSSSGGGDEDLVVTARFRTSWSLYNDDPIASARCAVDSTVVLVECTRPGDTIALLDVATSVTCSPKSDNKALNCIDAGVTFVDEYDSFVDYECTGALGDSIPATQVRLDPTTATCRDNGSSGRSVRIGHGLLLEPFCSSVGFFSLDSRFVECQFGNEFYHPQVDDIFRFSCAETVLFDSTGSTTATSTDIPSAVIMTDRSWQENYFVDCVRTATRSSPTNAPSVVAATPTSTTAPPVVESIPVPNDNSKEEESRVGLIVGVSVGAVFFLVLAGAVLFYVLYCKQLQPLPPQQKDSRVNDASEDRDHTSDPSQIAGYQFGHGDSGGNDRRFAVGEGQYMGHATAVAAPPVPYAEVQVIPASAIIGNASSGSERGGTSAKSLGSSMDDSGERSAPGGGGGGGSVADGSGSGSVGDGGRYRYPTANPGQQLQDVSVTYKDQVQSLVVDGRPITAPNKVLAPRMADDRPTAASNSRRQAYQQQDNKIAAPDSFKDNTQSMIRPGGIRVPASTATTALLEENDHAGTFSSSGLSDIHTRRSSDPSGIYPHEDMSMPVPKYSPNSNNRRAGSDSAGRLRLEM